VSDATVQAAAPTAALDAFDARRVRRAGGKLAAFNAAGVLTSADLHVALRLGEIAGERDEDVLLAVALAVRAPRIGHVRLDLAGIRASAAVDVEEAADLDALPWPEPAAWREEVAASGLVAAGETDDGSVRPLRLVGAALYLDRYWREERRVAADLLALAAAERPDVDASRLRDGLARLFEPASRQAQAAATAVLRSLSVVAGGPGTGKTTVVARIVALLAEQAAAAGEPAPVVALAAPTGKAAARLQEVVRAEALALDVDRDVRSLLESLDALTLHRLLGRRPASRSRFRHDRANRLPHDVVVVDETSMVSLWMMGRLLEAVRPGARLILVGDPGQLTSIEAGAVLGDVVGPVAGGRLRLRAPARAALEAATGAPVDAAPASDGAAIGDGIVVLDRSHRYGTRIAAVAGAVRAGDADALLAALRATGAVSGLAGATDPAAAAAVAWVDADAADPDAPAAIEAIRAPALASAGAVEQAARTGDAPAALEALGAFRLLCAHRRGPYGAAVWMARVQQWLAEAQGGAAADAAGAWYAGRPLLVTENDPSLRLANGDTGVVVAGAGGRLRAVFERGGRVVDVSPTRLAAVETVYAMTIHKSQGSQFATAVVVLPDPSSRLLTRELLYTAVTRARTRLVLVGTEAMIRAALERPVARGSGLGGRLWGAD
jgi:exodeoxyribonuclease V alpha subunit